MAKKKPSEASTSSYSLRIEQEAMPELPTQAPQQKHPLARLAEQMQLAPDQRVKRILAAYRGKPVAAEQVGFGFAPTNANNLTIFDLLKKL